MSKSALSKVAELFAIMDNTALEMDSELQRARNARIETEAREKTVRDMSKKSTEIQRRISTQIESLRDGRPSPFPESSTRLVTSK